MYDSPEYDFEQNINSPYVADSPVQNYYSNPNEYYSSPKYFIKSPQQQYESVQQQPESVVDPTPQFHRYHPQPRHSRVTHPANTQSIPNVPNTYTVSTQKSSYIVSSENCRKRLLFERQLSLGSSFVLKGFEFLKWVVSNLLKWTRGLVMDSAVPSNKI